MLIAILIYFAILLIVARLTGKGSNDAFFRAGRKSPWMLVAFGMIGASISGVTFIGVPGWVMTTDMTYIQMCLGFIVGYVIVAFVLLPLYYKLGLTSIYTYLQHRLGNTSYKTGAWFFIISKLMGAAAKFYVVVQILQVCVADQYGIPYAVTAIITLLFIWIYTRRSGIRTLVWTDVLQTFILLTALVIILIQVCAKLDFSFADAWTAIWNNPHAKMFEFSDWTSKQQFWKQFLSGIFVVIVMTGLDQDMMQKNLTCKNLRAAQKDMCSYGVMFVPVNLLFLALGILLLLLYSQIGMEIPEKGDALLANIVLSGTLGQTAMICFGIGVVASAFSSADSSMTALTTSFCIDILQKEYDERLRKRVHLLVMIAFLICTLAFNAIGSGSVMDLIYTLVSYTYGPLLGLFAFSIFTKWQLNNKWVPFVAIASPILCYVIDYATLQLTGYKFGYEILMFNGLLTFIGLWAIRCGKSYPSPTQKI
ncbi:MAG: sodium:solute symporter [Bacteroidaceae bacterium]|nr:sodium:solute symporter [Bacteroidaceae bacterium]